MEYDYSRYAQILHALTRQGMRGSYSMPVAARINEQRRVGREAVFKVFIV